MSEPQRILIIRPSALGDVARTVPALVSLRAAYPRAQIDWVVEQGFEPIIAHHPALSSAIPFPKKQAKSGLRAIGNPDVRAFFKVLRTNRYDVVFDLQGLARSGLMTLATRAPSRFGLRQARELAWLAYTHRVNSDIERHTVDRMLDVIAAAGVTPVRDMRLHTDPLAKQWADSLPWIPGRFVVVAPTSRWSSKQWPADRFAHVCSRLADRNIHTVVVGARSERAQCEPVLRVGETCPLVHDLVGATSLGQLMAIIERSALVVANDSAALHIGVGTGRPTIALFGPTRVNRVGPYQREHEVIQHLRPGDSMRHKDPAARVMMDRISADEVLERIERSLAQP